MVKENLDAVLVGEVHIDLQHAYEIAEIIKKLKPSVVLYEDLDEEKLSRLLKLEIGKSLRELCEMYGISLREAGFTKDALSIEKLKQLLEEVINNINSDDPYEKVYQYNTSVDLKYLSKMTYKEIINMPLVALHPVILKYFSEILEKKRKEFEKDPSKLNALNSIDIVLMNAKFISEDFRKFLQYVEPRVYIIISAAKQVGAKIGAVKPVFLDYSLSYYKVLKRDIEEYIKGKIYERPEYERFIIEKAMADSIEKYVKERQTDAPIIAIMGKAHVKSVAKLLEDRGIKCKVIELEDSIKDHELLSAMNLLSLTSAYINVIHAINILSEENWLNKY